MLFTLSLTMTSSVERWLWPLWTKSEIYIFFLILQQIDTKFRILYIALLVFMSKVSWLTSNLELFVHFRRYTKSSFGERLSLDKTRGSPCCGENISNSVWANTVCWHVMTEYKSITSHRSLKEKPYSKYSFLNGFFFVQTFLFAVFTIFPHLKEKSGVN